ncbi:branched-chain amino acid ABC transporter permease [Paenibacillus melissococcoides]|uniref:Branched-chain amino acid ABC transporter permease n=1 Tax=Paenibacillus melissococcoides TaxID=2912268 RepID=A0ABM9G3I0_9BACL|nr:MULTISPECIES: branched-chain amino acid ABC transporter permease [Paenibacillus]MEB9892238.1 branched-chain amino acid ABC transporter permease [Bacillus cereus]CAH8245890.1 branched-chain amino acid ABC transporter permease [Paenibacillus melissococcoides]CAH8712378.1 branched-chain amino acid ABC transporter permease [Paenibacillus melissococcoides]CAH8713124.1 branched-chain amino acid ABC transporter permease [Paenibacillus melissococcoides]GIO77515.1 branched-chain amino acid ABC trans
MGFHEQIIQLIISGLTIGSIYALIATGFVITYNITGVLNFAQGEFAMLGAMIAISLVAAGLSYMPAFIMAILIVLVSGALFERAAIHPARLAKGSAMIIITIGVAIAVRGIALLIWGTDPKMLPPFTPGEPFNLFGAVVQLQSLWAIGVAMLSLIAMYVFFKRTFMGKAVTACVINRFAARLMGIKPEKMSLLSISASAALGAIGGIIIAPISGASYEMGLMLGMKAFIAAVIGGLTNAPAAIVGALIVGLLEAFTEGLWSSGYKDLVIFGVLLLVLFFLPNGLFAKISGKRV